MRNLIIIVAIVAIIGSFVSAYANNSQAAVKTTSDANAQQIEQVTAAFNAQ